MGRITSFSSEGKLSFGSGEEFNIRAVREDRAIPEDLREQYLKYRIKYSSPWRDPEKWERAHICPIPSALAARRQ
jgi:hypothetical protein